jgi:integrase
MSVFKKKVGNKPGKIWHYEFEVAGQRHRGTTGRTTKREAQEVEREAKREAQAEAERARIVTSADVSLRIEDASVRYHAEVCAGRASEDNALRELEWLVDHFKADRLLTDIDDKSVASMITKRRESKVPRTDRLITPSTVNQTTLRLQGMFTHAKDEWKVRFPNEPNWKKHKLHVKKNRARVFVTGEREALESVTRDDHAPFIEFALASALRLAACVSLRWSEVDFEAGEIRCPGKRKPDGSEKIEVVPITARIRTILESQRGFHEEFVFTFEAKRSVGDYKRGKRYPLAYWGAVSAFRRAKAKAGVQKFGFHSLRRDRATKVWKETRDIVAVNKLLNHGSLDTTMRYLGVDTSDVRAALEKTDSRHGVPPQGPPTYASKAA